MKTSTITDGQLEKDLKIVYENLGKPPSIETYRIKGSFHPCTYKRRYGSWNNALSQILGTIVRKTPQQRKTIACLNCGEKTINPMFCSSSCSAIYNNKKRIKHKPKVCQICDTSIHHSASSCTSCRTLILINKYGKKTIGEFRQLPAVAKNRYVRVRQHAEKVMKYYNLIRTDCLLCDYSNHVQLCHIKDIGSFPDNITLAEINSLTNLVYLCPNHHWDLDHDFLSPQEKGRITRYINAVRENRTPV